MQVDYVYLSLHFEIEVERLPIGALLEGGFKLGFLLCLTFPFCILFFCEEEKSKKKVKREVWEMLKEVVNPALGFLTGVLVQVHSFSHLLKYFLKK